MCFKFTFQDDFHEVCSQYIVESVGDCENEELYIALPSNAKWVIEDNECNFECESGYARDGIECVQDDLIGSGEIEDTLLLALIISAIIFTIILIFVIILLRRKCKKRVEIMSEDSWSESPKVKTNLEVMKRKRIHYQQKKLIPKFKAGQNPEFPLRSSSTFERSMDQSI